MRRPFIYASPPEISEFMCLRVKLGCPLGGNALAVLRNLSTIHDLSRGQMGHRIGWHPLPSPSKQPFACFVIVITYKAFSLVCLAPPAPAEWHRQLVLGFMQG